METNENKEIITQETVEESENAVSPTDPAIKSEDGINIVTKMDLEDVVTSEKLTEESPLPENEELTETPKVFI